MHISPPSSALTAPDAGTTYRSGAVARMLRMPVATLRVWERRYQVTQPALSASGQRLYSAADVQRLALLKRLSDLGHAIGSLAALATPELQDVAATHARALSDANTGQTPHRTDARPAPGGAWRLALIGGDLIKRLQNPALLRRLSRPLQVLGPYQDAAQAEAALRGVRVDAVLTQAAQWQADDLAGWQAQAPTLARRPSALLYRFAPAAACEALADAGTLLLREPQSDSALGQWLQGLLTLACQPAAEPPPDSVPALPRRWDDAALADFAGLSSTVACECPRHIAELLMQLSHFEAYSAECAARSPADEELHRYLHGVAASSRARFEAALEHIAVHEGLVLPLSTGAQP